MEKNVFSQASNWIFVGCMFIGIALGLYYNEVAIGTLLGMGVGFIARGLINLNREKKDDTTNESQQNLLP